MKIDSQFSSHWRNYVLQSVYASVTVFLITLVLGMEHAVIIASIGATAFIVFAMPNSISCQPKRIIGGHLLGFFVGACFAVFPFMNFLLIGALWHAMAVGITLFAMVVLDFEHPPAAGTALGMTVTGYSQDAAIAIITSVILLAFISHYAKPFIRDLV
jgi:CBS-domain-containing membrane protein